MLCQDSQEGLKVARMEEDSRQPSLLADADDLSERETLLFDVTNSQAYKAGISILAFEPLCWHVFAAVELAVTKKHINIKSVKQQLHSLLHCCRQYRKRNKQVTSHQSKQMLPGIAMQPSTGTLFRQWQRKRSCLTRPSSSTKSYW